MGFFPRYLSPVIVICSLFGESSLSSAVIDRSFMRFLSDCERELIEAAREDTSFLSNRLLATFLSDNGALSTPKTDAELELTLKQIANNRLIQRPAYVAQCFGDVRRRTGVPTQFSTYESVLSYFREMMPTSLKVIGCLQLESGEANPYESRVMGFLKEFLRRINKETLFLFLKFVTGCDVMPERIMVSFTEQALRAPVGRTCGSTLTLDHRHTDASL